MKRLMIAALALCMAAPAMAHETGQWGFVTTTRIADPNKDYPNPTNPWTSVNRNRFATYEECNNALQVDLADSNNPDNPLGKYWITEGVCVVAHHVEQAQ